MRSNKAIDTAQLATVTCAEKTNACLIDFEINFNQFQSVSLGYCIVSVGIHYMCWS